MSIKLKKILKEKNPKQKVNGGIKKLKLFEHAYLGELPSSKLMKMKWNPLTQKEPLKEEYVEIMHDLEEGLEEIQEAWEDWKNGPMTEPKHIKPAQKELFSYVMKWMKKNIK